MTALMNNDNNDKKKGGGGGGGTVYFLLVINDKFMKNSVCQVSYWRRLFLFLADITIFN